MSGAPPPGYSSESLLASQVQGAGSTIQPMAGGGMPAGYSGESLLAPQAAGVAAGAIQPLQGGAAAVDPAAALQASILPSAAEAEAALEASAENSEQQEEIKRAAEGAAKGAVSQGLSAEDAMRAAVAVSGMVAVEQQKKRVARQSRTSSRGNSRSSRTNQGVKTNVRVTPAQTIYKQTAPDVPVLLEYYALSKYVKYNLKGIKELMEEKRLRYARHERAWKQDLLQKWDKYEAYRKSTLWAPIQITTKTKAKESRAPLFTTSTDANSWRTGHQAILHLNPAMTSNEYDSTLIVIPPLRGKIENLVHALESIPAQVKTINGKPQILIDPGVIVVFSYPYYTEFPLDIERGTDHTATNVLFLSVFLDLFLANKKQVAVLVKHEANAFGVGLALEAYRSGSTRNAPLVNFLEPAYALYTIPSDGDPSEIKAVCVTSAGLDTEKSIPYVYAETAPLASIPRLIRADSTAEAASVSKGVLVVRGSTIGKKMPTGLRQRQHHDKCTALESSGEAKDVYAFIKDTPDPYLNLSLTITPTEAGVDKADLFWLAFRFRYEQPARPLCKEDVRQEGESVLVTDRFMLSPEAVTTNVSLFPILGAGATEGDPPRTYQIRIPTDENRVTQDWLSQKFTEDEALYLNSLGFSPEILEQAFVNRRDDVSWQYLLAEFLTDLLSTNCFLDTQMITDSRCERVREFMEAIHTYFIEANLTKTDVETKQNEAVRDELERLQNYERRKREATQASVQNQPTLEDGAYLEPDQFRTGKLAWGTLYVYDILGEKVQMKAANVLIIQKDTGQHFYYSVRVPADQYKKDPNLLYKKVEGLRSRHPGYFFIY